MATPFLWMEGKAGFDRKLVSLTKKNGYPYYINFVPDLLFKEIKMKKLVTAIPLIAMLMLVASTALAHDGAHEGESHGMYEEGSGGSAMEMDRKSRAMAHEYKEEGSGGMGGDHSGMMGEHSGMEHSREYYEKKYGKYDHEKHEMMEKGHNMKDEAMHMKEMRMEEGSH